MYDGDTFEHKGRTFRVTFPHDDSMQEPWKEHDGHGIVSDWTTRDKGPGERVLVADQHHRRYYDFAETLKLARKDGWGVKDGKREGETDRAYTARAVEEDFEFLRAWCADEWTWIGVVVTLLEDGEPTTEVESLWGIESNAGEYLETVARELADEIMARVEVETPQAQVSEN